MWMHAYTAYVHSYGVARKHFNISARFCNDYLFWVHFITYTTLPDKQQQADLIQANTFYLPPLSLHFCVIASLVMMNMYMNN